MSKGRDWFKVFKLDLSAVTTASTSSATNASAGNISEQASKQLEESEHSLITNSSAGEKKPETSETLENSDPTYQKVISETSFYSITPRTFTQRTIITKEVATGNTSTSSEAASTISGEKAVNARFEDIYTHGAQTVHRFGINSYDDSMNLNQNEVLKQHSQIAHPLSLKSSSSKVSSNSASGNKKSTAAAASESPENPLEKDREEAKKQITQYEKDCVKKAIDHLNPTGSSTHIPKTVLVDVFVREKETGKIRTIPEDEWRLSTKYKDGTPDTHTVVLFAQNGKYLVIDPSNVTFSHVLTGADDNIRVCFEGKNFQIYKPVGQTGPHIDQWRDCIDAAVKLAFNIEFNIAHGIHQTVAVQEQDEKCNNGRITYNTLQETVLVKEVTNNSNIYSKIPKELSTTCPMRLKQSSDVKIGKKVDAILKIVHKISDDLLDEMIVMDLRHSQPAFEQKIADFYNTTVSSYEVFERESIRFLHDIECITKSGKAVELLGMELTAIDHLQ